MKNFYKFLLISFLVLASPLQVLYGQANPTSVFCRNSINKEILDNSILYDTIQAYIPPFYYGIHDVNVKIDTVFHTYDSDLEFSLKHISTEAIIIQNVGGSGNNFIGTVLNDSAVMLIVNGYAPFTGSYVPSHPLSIFNGYSGPPGGNWILKITDEQTGDTGCLKAWCITISYYYMDGGIHSVTIPNYFALKHNYPNPFNPSTKIEYAIPRQGNVKLAVYDILGKEIAVLVDELKNPGIYTVDFDGSKLSSGVYLYKIVVQDPSASSRLGFTDTKKMLLIK